MWCKNTTLLSALMSGRRDGQKMSAGTGNMKGGGGGGLLWDTLCSAAVRK